MNWFNGNISEAVAASKNKNAVFVVYVEGTDDSSGRLTKMLDEPMIRAYLEGPQFVAVKIQSDSEAYTQFCQIYKVVPLPSIFFIGKNGTPLLVATGLLKDSNELDEKIKSVLQNFYATGSNAILSNPNLASAILSSDSSTAGSSSSNAFLASERSTASSDQKDYEVVCKDGVCQKVPTERKENSDVTSQGLSSDEKVIRAQKLIEENRKAKEAEEKKAERERELERRRTGQEIRNMKKMQEEQEMKNLIEERKKQKLEDQAVRQRILDQIAQDRNERNERFGMQMGGHTSTPKPQEPVTPPAPSKPLNSTETMIQFKKPTGESTTFTFAISDTFLTVRNYVAQNILTGSHIRDFTLATTFPRKEYTEADNDNTLQELSLVPTAVLLVLPLKKTSSGHQTVTTRDVQSYSNFFTTLFWSLVTPVMNIFSYLRGLVFGGGSNQNVVGNQKKNEETEAANDAAKKARILRGVNDTLNNMRSSQTSGTSAVKRIGSSNVHRLTENRESDDDNNTWNGNSTQQQ